VKPQPLDPLGVPLNGSHLVEASAGTGKTYAIATLYVRLLLERDLRAGQILVVTYTNAATAELRVRIRNRLRDTLAALEAGNWPGDETLDAFIRARCARGADSVRRDRAALLAALHAFDEAAIFTIHGFCQRVLQENAFESGVAFDSELLADVSALVDEVVADYWVRRLHDGPLALIEQLGASKVGLETLRNIAMRVITHADIEIVPDLAGPPGVDEALAVQVLRFKHDLAEYARGELRRRKQAARQQSFDDLLQRLREALRGPGGESLVTALRERYRAALVDEFQDTDPVQYGIFHRIYIGTELPFFVIGDPKQAIYAFRGADVFTYVEAQRDVGAAHTLLTNRRSDPTLLRAINTIFRNVPAPFALDQIGYEPIQPPADARDRLGGSRRGKPPFEILFVRRDGLRLAKTGPRLIVKDAATGRVTEGIAAHAAGLLAEGVTLSEGKTERALQPSDVAILCRQNREAAEVQSTLRRHGIHAVLQSDATVFETAEAAAVQRALQALANPTDGRSLRAALSTPLLGLDAAGLDAVIADEAEWDRWAGRFRDWHDRWLNRSFVVAFRTLLDECDVERRMLGQIGGERQLTDVLHLVELLHRACVDLRLGPQALVHWLAQMRRDPSARSELVGEAARVRLESDEAAAKLVTVHRSKGLEYPVVLCPFSWGPADLHRKDKIAPRFHDRADGDRLKLDLGSEDFKDHEAQAARETLAEELRLLYVAFTRARHYCGVVWGPFRGGQNSALAYVLHRATDKTGAERVARLSDDAMLAELEALAGASGGAVSVAVLTSTSSSPVPQAKAATPPDLQLPPIRRDVRSRWRTSSFSALTSDAVELARPEEEGVDHDTVEPAAGVDLAAATVEPLLFADLRAGARSGQLVHRLFEKLDFEARDATDLRSRIDSLLSRSGSERALSEALSDGIAAVLAAPLGASAAGLCLGRISARRRLNELEFLLPVTGNPPLTVARLASVFRRHGHAAYAERVAQLGFMALEGFLKGYIDLVFEHDRKWYVVDYKTNFLGPAASDYIPNALTNAMAAHHYVLQYHLYAVAVHRHLAARIRDYGYDKHFGGVYYLFLRGMSARFAAGNGIFFDRPQPGLIEELASLFTPVDGARAPGGSE